MEVPEVFFPLSCFPWQNSLITKVVVLPKEVRETESCEYSSRVLNFYLKQISLEQNRMVRVSK